MDNKYCLTNKNELYHYGVKGMKWGVRKEEYKSMNRQQRKKTREEYYKTSDGKKYQNIRNTVVGTILLGPLGGAAVGLITAHRNGSLQKTVSKGKDYVEKTMTTRNVNVTVSNKTESKRVAELKKRVTGKESNGKPIFLMSEQERNQFDQQYEARRQAKTTQYRKTSDPKVKKRILDELDQMENDYMSIVEQDFWYSDD